MTVVLHSGGRETKALCRKWALKGGKPFHKGALQERMRLPKGARGKNPLLRTWKQWLFIVAALLPVLCLIACTSVPPTRRGPTGKREPEIRVLLLEEADEVTIDFNGPVQVTAQGGFPLFDTEGAGSIDVSAQQSSLYFRQAPSGSVSTTDGEVVINPGKQSMLSIRGVSYPGRIVVSATAGRISLVNILPIETYLEGVLPHEMGDPGPHGYAALQAQAIAARTYALAKMRKRRYERFDVVATVMDQLYRGTEGAYRLATGAARDTRGRVLEYQDELVRAYYSACCGGHTSDIRRVWPEREPAAYLTGIRDIDGISKKTCCREYRRFRWRHSFSGRELGQIIRETLPRELGINEDNIGAFRDVRILERSASGRVTSIEIETSKGLFRVQGDRIRWVLMIDPENNQILPSTMFDISKSMEGNTASFVSITGGGNGHGVGMCQSGAIGMAKQGYTYQMILSHYYTGCRVKKEY
ncbi:MAG: SpoIID/LytB domain-containing protein [Candidatus Latescibacteria bacterium]|nr:SpoIID/LytB domain-containing protein [Candidatus Latescibacterota bacterium]NIM22218.1 SpoIID/LytB domain-containing protein [Candidatus Latescibacterota bacterium]NIM66257.1 SpoIID/LytB domain-containing protein [Candidatus Latescibacterota bacterium]NIO02334.1 SpoIID/LytB domain-containing protein [Candidatus Latescibacterota bacterium]NIO29865.1 SpoIID/LytB domain-containing protein [Candidatus Latescibacterota bacterium]